MKRDFHGAGTLCPEASTNERDAVLNDVANTATAWWAMKRPVKWGVEDHVTNPTVNCHGEDEKELARQVARWYGIEHGHKEGVGEGPAPCRDPRGHEWNRPGEFDGGTDPSHHGEGRCVCIYCGARGDA